MLRVILGPLSGFQAGTKLDNLYQASVTLEQTPCLLIHEWINDKWCPRGSWYVHTIMQGTSDELYLAYSQEWYVTGMSKIRECFREAK